MNIWFIIGVESCEVPIFAVTSKIETQGTEVIVPDVV